MNPALHDWQFAGIIDDVLDRSRQWVCKTCGETIRADDRPEYDLKIAVTVIPISRVGVMKFIKLNCAEMVIYNIHES